MAEKTVWPDHWAFLDVISDDVGAVLKTPDAEMLARTDSYFMQLCGI